MLVLAQDCWVTIDDLLSASNQGVASCQFASRSIFVKLVLSFESGGFTLWLHSLLRSSHTISLIIDPFSLSSRGMMTGERDFLTQANPGSASPGRAGIDHFGRTFWPLRGKGLGTRGVMYWQTVEWELTGVRNSELKGE